MALLAFHQEGAKGGADQGGGSHRKFASVFWHPNFIFQFVFYPAQYLALLVGVIYFDQDYDQEGVQNIDGALFWVCMNQFFSTYTSMLTAREPPLKIKKLIPTRKAITVSDLHQRDPRVHQRAQQRPLPL